VTPSKKPTRKAKRKTKRKTKRKAASPAGHQFGVLKIPKNAIITTGANVDGGAKAIDSLECWEEYNGQEE
jgi:hypothetical protein